MVKYSQLTGVFHKLGVPLTIPLDTPENVDRNQPPPLIKTKASILNKIKFKICEFY